ncbi:MAG: hypothetical protein IIC86_00180 [Chloroflexi bacterium]|nr:hypothetical protein [Chloroflexota bacterium]
MIKEGRADWRQDREARLSLALELEQDRKALDSVVGRFDDEGEQVTDAAIHCLWSIKDHMFAHCDDLEAKAIGEGLSAPSHFHKLRKRAARRASALLR